MKKHDETKSSSDGKISRARRFIRTLFFVGVVSGAMILGALLGIFGSLMREMPQISELDRYRPRLNTRVFAAKDGRATDTPSQNDKPVKPTGGSDRTPAVPVAEFTRENRVLASLSEIPVPLRQALLSIEDERFYNHHGLDFIGIARAIIVDIKARRFVQGASTLSQQLARNLDLGISRERTLKRKMLEAILALQIERKFTKDEILEMYLNQVYLGHRSYGVEAGARTYFGKHVGDLNLAESAMLAGLPKAPSTYDPYRNPEGARNRRNLVLDKMFRDGVISKQEKDAASARPVLTGRYEKPEQIGPYFVEYVRRQLVERFDENLVYSGGLTVSTTLDIDMQLAAEKAVANGLAWYVENHRVTEESPADMPQVALVAIDPRTGHILAMVGGRDFKESPFNRATQGDGRQPGSAFKPIVWATAFEKGYTPGDIVYDAPIEYGRILSDPDKEEMNPNKLWRPENFEKEYFGDVTLRYALEHSLNICAVKLLQDIGISTVRANARRLGVESRIDFNLSIAMGTSVARPIEMAAAYATLANQGVYMKPKAILEVKDPDDQVLMSQKKESRVAISKEAAYLVIHVMQDIIERGTGSAAKELTKSRPAAGKTGTTDDQRDAWFVGCTPDLACAVWVGHDLNMPLGRTKNGLSMTGGRIACPIWTEFMKGALEGRPVLQFEKPVDVVLVDGARVNADNGLPVPPGVKGRRTKYSPKSEGPYIIEIEDAYIRGTESEDPRRVSAGEHEGRID